MTTTVGSLQSGKNIVIFFPSVSVQRENRVQFVGSCTQHSARIEKRLSRTTRIKLSVYKQLASCKQQLTKNTDN